MKYRKKPVEIEAIKWNGSNVEEVINFCNDKVIVYHEQLLNGVKCDSYSVSILTLEGVMGVDVGDYIIKGIKGECYPCKPDIFEMTYEKCEKKIDMEENYTCELCFWDDVDQDVQCEKCGRYFCEDCGSYGERICNGCKDSK